MIILDTNVVSEMMRTEPSKKVLAWLRRHDAKDLGIAAMTVTELWFGAMALDDEFRKLKLRLSIEDLLKNVFADRVVAFNLDMAKLCGQLMANTKASTPDARIADLQIAATAIVLGSPVATRNVRDFQHAGLQLINPWEA
jgi:toxin FitB